MKHRIARLEAPAMRNVTEIRVLYADTDAMSIVYHTNYIKWFEAGRNELLRSLDHPYTRLEEQGFLLPLTECCCSFRSPAVYDDLLEIEASLGELKAASMRLDYRIFRKGTGELLAEGYTTHAVTDRKFKPVRLSAVAPDLYRIMTEKTDKQPD